MVGIDESLILIIRTILISDKGNKMITYDLIKHS